ncbi:MAG: inverse autotransporter beta domain-containing protein [Deltaproteobacteria bacterium]|nr:inverse autotransporter beta domain-containing protein [Deltaproteobacteria bacterium]
MAAQSIPVETFTEGWLKNGARIRINPFLSEDGDIYGELDAFIPLFDGETSAFFAQLGLRKSYDGWVGNLGMGRRYFPTDNFSLGYNLFFDHDFSENHSRMGAGLELWHSFLRLSSNAYIPLSNWKPVQDNRFGLIEEKPAGGWDARLKAYLPFYPNISLTGGFSQWYGDYVLNYKDAVSKKCAKIWSYGIEFTPVKMVTFYYRRNIARSNPDNSEYGMYLTYNFGSDISVQTSHDLIPQLREVEASRHDFVDRENRIILNIRAKNDAGSKYVINPKILSFTGYDEGGFSSSIVGTAQYTITPAPQSGWKISETNIGTATNNMCSYTFNSSTGILELTWSGDLSGNRVYQLYINFADGDDNFIGTVFITLTMNDNV